MTNSVASRQRAIFIPWVDALCAGGLSIALIIFLLESPEGWSSSILFSKSIAIATLLNFPHFMASYRLLYSSREQVRRYPAASLYIPAALVLYAVVSLGLVARDEHYGYLIDLLLVVTSYYLAQHYTGQTWGMMSSFAYLDGVSFNPIERRIFSYSLRYLLVWQVLWATSMTTQLPREVMDLSAKLMPFANVVLIGTLLLGGAGFWSLVSRTGKFPPIRVIIPFLAVYLWYCLMYRHPSALFWVQNAHALQYLIFPIRVEVNRRAVPSENRVNLTQVLTVYLTLVATGFFVFSGVEKILSWDGSDFRAYITVMVACINIHHFFIDGCIWKISNPIVKDELFAHLKPS